MFSDRRPWLVVSTPEGEVVFQVEYNGSITTHDPGGLAAVIEDFYQRTAPVWNASGVRDTTLLCGSGYGGQG